MDRVIDSVQNDLFYGGYVQSWQNKGTTVFLPSPDNDVLLVFVHFVRHFYKEGVNLRQLCDWCRLLWTYRESLNHELLESRIKKAGLLGEWKSFAAMAVDYCGMPVEVLPLYSIDRKWHVKGEKIARYVLEDKGSNKICQTLAIAKIFPGNTIKFSPSILLRLICVQNLSIFVLSNRFKGRMYDNSPRSVQYRREQDFQRDAKDNHS